MADKKPRMTVSQSRAHHAAHKDLKEKHRHAEQNRRARVDEKTLDIREAEFDLKMQREQERKQRQQEQDEIQRQKDAEASQRQAERDEQNRAKSESAKRKKQFRGAVHVADNVLGGSDEPKISHTTPAFGGWSLGMVFLVILFVFWMTLNKAPGHPNDSRMSVIWKAISGKEEIA